MLLGIPILPAPHPQMATPKRVFLAHSLDVVDSQLSLYFFRPFSRTQLWPGKTFLQACGLLEWLFSLQAPRRYVWDNPAVSSERPFSEWRTTSSRLNLLNERMSHCPVTCVSSSFFFSHLDKTNQWKNLWRWINGLWHQSLPIFVCLVP